MKISSLLLGVSDLGCMLIRTQLDSFFRFSVLADLERFTSDFVALRPAATDAYDRLDGSETK
jgi:hypothetical protein